MAILRPELCCQRQLSCGRLATLMEGKLKFKAKSAIARARAIGRLLRLGRKRAGFTVDGAAERARTTKSQLGRIEAGQISNPTAETVRIFVTCADIYGLNRNRVLRTAGCRHVRVSEPKLPPSPFQADRLTAYEARELRRYLEVLRGRRPK